MIPYLEKTGGVWFCKGGMYNLVRALENIFKGIGGTVETDAEVEQVVVENRARAKGVLVRVNSERDADINGKGSPRSGS